MSQWEGGGIEQASPYDRPRAQGPGWSTLPEVAPAPSLPEVAPAVNLPEVVPEIVPDIVPEDSAKFGPATTPQADSHQRGATKPRLGWLRRRRNRIILAVVVAVLIIIGIVVGVVVPLTGRKRLVIQKISYFTNNHGFCTPTDTVSLSSGDSQGGGEGANPTSALPAFGTPTSFPTPASGVPASACQGTVCPQMLASTGLANPATTFLFGRGSDSSIWYREIGDGLWQTEWKSLGGTFLSQPAAASMRDGRVDVFAIWADQSARFKTFLNGTWDTEWTSLGGACTSPPVACGVPMDNMDVMVAGTDHAVYHKFYDRNITDWGPAGDWENLKGWVSSSPQIGCATNSEGVRRLDLVAYGGGQEYGMYFKMWNATSGWDVWRGGVGAYRGDPTLVSTADRVDHFGIGTDAAIWHSSWTNAEGHTNAASLGGTFQSAVSAIATGASRLDVLAVGNDTRLKHKAQMNGTWGTEWEDLGGYFNSAPKAVVLNETVVAIFGIGPNGTIIHTTFTIGTRFLWGPGDWYSDGGSMASNWYRLGPA